MTEISALIFFGVETVRITAWSKKQCAIDGPVK